MELYPDRLLPLAICDENNKWSAALIEFVDGISMGETIYALDGYIYDTDKEALSALDSVLRFIIESMKVMSN